MPIQPKIDYPCPWEYALIGASEALIRQAILETLGETEHTLTPSHASATGKYVSFHLRVVVQDEPHRNAIFRALHSHRNIKAIL